MIYFHADDYGINVAQSKRILSCRTEGCLNSVSILPTSDCLGETIPMLDDECKKAVHINISEGKSLLSSDEIPMLVDGKRHFNRSFVQMLIQSIFRGRELERQVEKECYAQISEVIKYLPSDYILRLDSHRHYHMVPAVLRGVCKAAKRTNRDIEYIRLPMEKLSLYLADPALWPRISPLSIVKALVLNTCGAYNKHFLKKEHLLDKTSPYIGVIFTDRMFYENISPLLKKIKAGKVFKGENVEIQFHPGAVREGETLHETNFVEWYSSENRDKEAEALKRF